MTTMSNTVLQGFSALNSSNSVLCDVFSSGLPKACFWKAAFSCFCQYSWGHFLPRVLQTSGPGPSVGKGQRREAMKGVRDKLLTFFLPVDWQSSGKPASPPACGMALVFVWSQLCLGRSHHPLLSRPSFGMAQRCPRSSLRLKRRSLSESSRSTTCRPIKYFSASGN